MDYKKENAADEQGSLQKQTQRNEQYNGNNEFGLIPTAETEDNIINKEIEFEKINGETATEEIKIKRNSWNAITFDNDDFTSGLIPA